jgi:hypothetical protein
MTNSLEKKPIGNWGQLDDPNEYQLEVDDNNWVGAVAVVKEEIDGKWWVMHGNYNPGGGCDTPEETVDAGITRDRTSFETLELSLVILSAFPSVSS